MDKSDFKHSEDYESEEYYADLDYVQLIRSLDIMCFIVFCLVFVVGVLGNGVVIWVTAFKLKKTVNTVWFLNLTVADLLFTAFLPLTLIHQAMDFHWPFGRLMCKLHFTVDSLTKCASVYVLVVMSVDRCVSVVWPAWDQHHHSVRKASYASLGVWVLALVLSFPDFFLDTRPNLYIDNYTECSSTIHFSNFTTFYYNFESPFESPVTQFRDQALDITLFLLTYVVPLAIIVSCYAVIIHRLRKSCLLSSHWRGHPFRITAAVITSFFLCFAPFHIVEIIYVMPLTKSERLRVVWIYLASCLEALYRCLKPLLYVLVGQDFKNKARKPILNVLESAFTEEEPPSKPSTNFSLSDAE